MSFTYEYPRPAVTVDCIVYKTVGASCEILLIRRKNDPFQGMWALPGGFVDLNEDPDFAVRRELQEETGILATETTQLFTVGQPGRDPRGHTISIIYALKITDDVECRAGDDAAALQWFSCGQLPALAFDHGEVILRWMEKRSD